VQTSPLGLGGYYRPTPPQPPQPPQPPSLSQSLPAAQAPPPMPASEPAPGDELRTRFEQAARSLNDERPADNMDQTGGPPPAVSTPAWCQVCGNGLGADMRFCPRCGAATPPPVT